MRYSKIELPVSLETPQVTWRAVECGGMVMEYVSFTIIAIFFVRAL